MLFARSLQRAMDRTRRTPAWMRWSWAAAITGTLCALRLALDGLWPAGYPLILSYGGIIVCAALFSGGAGLLSTLLFSGFAVFFYLPPLYSWRIGAAEHVAALAVFAGTGIAASAVINALQDALDRLRESERVRLLQLREYRHRIRNDLASLSAVLLLRARSSTEEARVALREAAQHAVALSRVHTRLAAAGPGAAADAAYIDTAEFVDGLVEDLRAGMLAGGLRPVALTARAQSWPLDTERAVQLGLTLNETVTNALKYAFPGDEGGEIRVEFWREGEVFHLAVTDDGVGLPPAAEVTPATPRGGLGTRLLRALAAQLRGHFARGAGPDGQGTRALLSFPVSGTVPRPPARGAGA